MKTNMKFFLATLWAASSVASTGGRQQVEVIQGLKRGNTRGLNRCGRYSGDRLGEGRGLRRGGRDRSGRSGSR